jgi:PAS domain S-box-containing protein
MPDSPFPVTATSARPAAGDGTGAAQDDSGKQVDLLNHLLARLPDAIICLDREWRITFANAEARRISRLTDADLNSKTHWEIFPESVGTDLELTYRRVMLTGASLHVEYFHRPFNLWVDVQVLPTREGIALYYRDISDRKRAESLRATAVRQLQQIFDASPDSIIGIDCNWNCTFANLAARTILKANDLIGANLWTRFPSSQAEPFASNYRTAMERRIPAEFEAYYPAPLNIWFKVSARPYEDGIIIFSSDITNRKKAEARRDANSRQLQQVFDTTTDAVVSLSRDWTFTFLNRRARLLLSVKGDLIGRNLWEEFPETQSGNFFAFLNRAMHERIPGEFEDFYPDPLNLWLNVQCIPSDDGVVVFFRDISAARASKQILLNQQAVLSFVQQTARVATWEINLTTGAICFGDGSCPVFGRPCSEIKTIEDLRNIVQPAHLPLMLAATRKAISTGLVCTVDYQVIAPDGHLLWVEGRGIPVFNEDGVATHLRGMTTDITSRKQNEEELAASEERYRVLADLNPQAIWMGDAQGNITYANQGFLDYIGLTMADEDEGHLWLRVFCKEDRLHVLDTWTHAVATGEEYEIEARMIRAADGASRWWWLRALPIRDEAGNILNWLGVAMDIQDRKTYAETLRAEQQETERQRAELETIYQTAPIGLALFDPVEFRYLRVNDRQAETLGLPKDQIIGRPIFELAPLKGLRELFHQAAAGIPVRSHLLEGELPTRPGEHRYWNVSYSPVLNPDGKVEAIAAVIQEITNQKKSENALIQSEKLAAVGRLASSISHEINNPLEAITNLLYLVAVDESLSETLKPYISMAQSELSRVCQIATQTLRFHRQAVSATHVLAQDLVNAVLNLYQGRLVNSGIEVDAVYASTTPILCFENDIRQVLNNLIANAIDSMRQHGGGRLFVRAHDSTTRTATHPNGIRGVRITIADTGHGMSPEVQSRIFEPFYTTKDLNGTGLGLWISTGIVQRHNGSLTFRTSRHPVHHGTIFALFLPHEEVPQETQTTAF